MHAEAGASIPDLPELPLKPAEPLQPLEANIPATGASQMGKGQDELGDSSMPSDDKAIGSPMKTPGQIRRRGRPAKIGCVICGLLPSHSAIKCPVVQSGSSEVIAGYVFSSIWRSFC